MDSSRERPRCLVIGAAGGIGRALVGILRREGWSLVLAGRRAEPLAELARGTGDRFESLDATDVAAVEMALHRHGELDAAVNLAGSILLKPAHLTSAADFELTIAQNLRSAFAVVRAAGLTMRGRGGSVVLMSSCAAAVGLANHEAIAAAKAGIEGLTRSAAATYASSRVRFNAVAPGLVDTPLAERITRSESALKASLALHPLGRIGTPDDIARAIAFLVDPANDWITGQVIGVDGGLANLRGR